MDLSRLVYRPIFTAQTLFMKKSLSLPLAFSLAMAGGCMSLPAVAQFTPGNVVVYQVGNGVITGNVSAPVFIKEFSSTAPSQTIPVTTIALPFSGAGRLVNGYTATSEGFLSLSTDSSRLTFGGYDTSAGIAAVGTSTSANIARAIDTIGAAGIPGRVTITNTAFSANSIRAVTANNANNYWATGGTSAVYYMGMLNNAGTISSAPTNNRVLHALNGNLYFTTASAAGSGLWKIKGQPFNTTKPDTPALLINTGASSSSPYGFAVNAGETVAYIADDRTTAINAGGVYRWTLSGGVWTATDTLKPGTGAAGGVRGVAVDWSGTYPVIFATTNDNRLIRWVDSSNFSHIYSVLATAPTNTAFRSVAMAPRVVVCPASPSAVVSPLGTLGYCAGDTIRLVTNKTPGLNYLWTMNGTPISAAATTDSAIRVAATGIYNVMVNRNIRCFDTGAGTPVIFSPKPNNQITLSTNDSVCASDTIRLHSISGAGLKYLWTGISGLNVGFKSAGLQDSSFALFANTSVTVPLHFTLSSVVITNGTPGCSDTETVDLTFVPLPNANIVYNAGALMAPSGFTSYKWYLNGNQISGATAANYVPVANGTYSVTVTDSFGCSGGSNQVIVSSLSINTATTRAGIRLHPNPVTDVLHVDAAGPVSITLRDMQGRTLLQRAGVKELSLKDFPAGLYSITLYGENGFLIGTELLRKTH